MINLEKTKTHTNIIPISLSAVPGQYCNRVSLCWQERISMRGRHLQRTLFEGCRLWCRPPKQQEYNVNSWFCRKPGFSQPSGPFKSSPDWMFIEIALGIAPKYRILSRKWVPDFWKNHFQHFCQRLNFYPGFQSNRLGQNDRNDHGIISGVHQKSDFDPCFAGQSQYFPEKRDFHFLCLKNLFFFGGQICGASKFPM